MAVVGQASAILNIAGIGFQLSLALSTYSRNKHVPSEVHELARTITSFSLVLKRSVAVFQSKKSICSIQAADTTQRIAKSSARVLDEIDDMLEEAQNEPEVDTETALVASGEYVQACFESRRVQYLLALIRCLDLNVALILQIAEVGKKVNLLTNTESEEQRNVNMLMIEQEWLVAQDILFVRQMQIGQVNKTWLALDFAAKQDTPTVSTPVLSPTNDTINTIWMGLPKLNSIEEELKTLFNSEESMSTVSQHAIQFLLGEWTIHRVDNDDAADNAPPVHQAPQEADGDSTEYYDSEDELSTTDDPQDYRRNQSRDEYRKHHRPSQDSRVFSDDEDDWEIDDDMRSHRRRPSRRSDASSSSRHGRWHRRQSSDSREGRRPSYHHHTSQSDDRSPDPKPKDDKTSDQKSVDKKPNKNDDKESKNEKEDDGNKGKEQKSDEDKKEDDSKGSKGDGGLGSIPLSAFLMPTLLKYLDPESGKDEGKGDTDKKAEANAGAGIAPQAAQAPQQPAAPAATGQPAKSPGISPRLGTAPMASMGIGPQNTHSNNAGQRVAPNPSKVSSAAQKYTPQGAALSGPRQPLASGNIPISHHHSTSPVHQYASQDLYSHPHRPSQLNSPPHDRYGPNRTSAPRLQGYEHASTSYDDRHPADRHHGSLSRPTSSHGQSTHYGDRLASPNGPSYPQSAQHRPQARPYDDRRQPHSASYHDQAYRHENRPPREGYLSPDDLRGRRFSASDEGREPYPSHRYDQRPSRSPPRRHEHDRPPSREYRPRRSPSRGRSSRSPKRSSGRLDPPRRSSRPVSRPASRPASSRTRPISTSGGKYRYKPSAPRAKIKPSNARAASRLLGSFKMNPGLIKGLGVFGKTLSKR